MQSTTVTKRMRVLAGYRSVFQQPIAWSQGTDSVHQR
jgi:hypothetical protein